MINSLITPNGSSKLGKITILDKIVKTEQSADFQTSQSKSLKKSEKAKKTADKKRAETIKQAQNAEISIETVKIQKLRQLAVNAYNDWNLSKFTEKRATIHDDSLFLDRITVNFIRQNLTVYDFLLVQQWDKVGKDYAVEIIRNRIFNLIGKEYPDLAQEAIRQKIAK